MSRCAPATLFAGLAFCLFPILASAAATQFPHPPCTGEPIADYPRLGEAPNVRLWTGKLRARLDVAGLHRVAGWRGKHCRGAYRPFQIRWWRRRASGTDRGDLILERGALLVGDGQAMEHHVHAGHGA